jgi:hypothetical protein
MNVTLTGRQSCASVAETFTINQKEIIMKQFLITLIVAGLMGSATGVWAGCGRCPSDKAAAAADGKCAGMGALSKMSLTEDQTIKVKAVREQCAKATSQDECLKICSENLAKILTPEQFKQWKASTAECAGAKGKCPVSGAAAQPAEAADGHNHKGCGSH